MKNIIDGLWHHVAVVNPDGGNHRNFVRLYLDGNEVKGYEQSGNPANISTGVNYSFRIGKPWNKNQRFDVLKRYQNTRFFAPKLSAN